MLEKKEKIKLSKVRGGRTTDIHKNKKTYDRKRDKKRKEKDVCDETNSK